MSHITPRLCSECGRLLNKVEADYYEYRCEQCEREWREQIEVWRHGGPDPELDELFDVDKGPLQ